MTDDAGLNAITRALRAEDHRLIMRGDGGASGEGLEAQGLVDDLGVGFGKARLPMVVDQEEGLESAAVFAVY